MERLKFIGKRLVYLVIMLFGVATLVFILTKLVPGNPVTANLSQRALSDPEIVAAYEAKYGLDEPIIVQYFLYIKNLLQLDLGTSIRTNNPVLSELARCYPATIELALFAIILAAIFGIPKKQHRRSGGARDFRYRRQHTELLVCASGIVFILLQIRNSSGTGAAEQHVFTAGDRDRFIRDRQPDRGRSGESDGCAEPSDSPGHRIGGLYDGFDHENDQVQSAGRHVYRLYSYSESERSVQCGAHRETCPGKCHHSGTDGDRPGLRKSAGRNGSRRDDFQLAGSRSVRLSVGYVYGLSVDHRRSSAHRIELYGN